MHFSAKKLFLIGFIVLLLVGIPATVYLVQQQQELRSRAEAATNLSFQPDSSVSNPIVKSIGQTIPLDIMVDPGTNLVTFVKVEIQYDPDKLATAPGAFQINSAVFPTVADGPVYSAGKISVAMSVGIDLTKAIQTKVRAATINLKALAGTGETTTLVTYSTTNTVVTSQGGNDQSSENVFAGSSPATILITGGASPTQPPVPTETPVPTGAPPVPTDIPQPTIPGATATPTPITSPAPTGTGTAPLCSALTTDALSGAAPLTINFTANGSDTDGTITKATFNFGDGQVSDVTTGGGIGTNAVNVPLAHTYSTAGTFQATAILTDDTDGVSETTNCAQTITVSGGSTVATATPVIPPSGTTETLLGFGAVALFMVIGGALLFFLL